MSTHKFWVLVLRMLIPIRGDSRCGVGLVEKFGLVRRIIDGRFRDFLLKWGCLGPLRDSSRSAYPKSPLSKILRLIIFPISRYAYGYLYQKLDSSHRNNSLLRSNGPCSTGRCTNRRISGLYCSDRACSPIHGFVETFFRAFTDNEILNLSVGSDLLPRPPY